MKIAILGGSFDPPHLGHLFIASQVKELVGVDEIWLMPLYQSHGGTFQKTLSSVKHRLEMTRLIESDDIKVSTFEIENNKTSYTIDTLTGISQQYPENTYYWIIGSD